MKLRFKQNLPFFTLFFISIIYTLGVFKERGYDVLEKDDINEINHEKLLISLYNPIYSNDIFGPDYYGWKFSKSDTFPTFNDPPENLPIYTFPQLGLYSVNDETVLLYHMKLLHDAGIDGILVYWYGFNMSQPHIFDESEYVTKLIYKILDAAEAFNILVGIHIQNCDKRSKETLTVDIEYIMKNYSSHSQYLRFNNKTVISIYDPHETAGFFEVSSSMKKKYENLMFLATCPSTDHLHTAVNSDIDAIFTYQPVINLSWHSNVSRWKEMKRSFEERGLMFIPTVGPGYNDTRISRYLGHSNSRNNGVNYEIMFQYALRNNDGLVIINSFNNWLEGTNIEPVVEYGLEFKYGEKTWMDKDPYSFIKLTRKYAEIFHSGESF